MSRLNTVDGVLLTPSTIREFLQRNAKHEPCRIAKKKMALVELTSTHVRAARALLRWNQEDLASRCAVSPATINYWENDKVIPTAETKTKVRRVFEEAGVEFLNGGNPGVRLIRTREG